MTTATGVVLNDLLDAALREQEQFPWHHEPKEDGYKWHASQLARCPRQSILKRAGYTADQRDRQGAMAAMQGTILHSFMELVALPAYLRTNPDAEVILQEVGFRHPTLNLAAKPDLVLRVGSALTLVDYKSQKEGSFKHRQEEARQLGVTTAAKQEHVIQLVATAMCIEACRPELILREGRLWYFSRQEWFTDEQPVDLQDSLLRAEVVRLVNLLDDAWTAYARAVLPHRIDLRSEGAWQCTPRKDHPTAGRWCDYRTVCYDRRMPA